MSSWKFTIKFIAKLTCTFLISGLVFSFKSFACETLSCDQQKLRVRHAHELLGKHYRKSVAKTGESVSKINNEIYRWTRERLPEKSKKHYKKIAQAIIDQSHKYEFDPVFLMSIIQGESSFIPERKGSFGEIGLMQIKPSTAKWITSKYDLAWKGRKSLLNPVINIQIGAAYLDYLRGRFDSHARLYIAAYNMGQSNVDSAQERNIWPKDYPVRVMKNYVEFYAALKSKEDKEDKEKQSRI